MDRPLWRALTNPTLWMDYSLDGNENIKVAVNTVLTGLLLGSHYLTVCANDTVTSTGVSERVYFDIEAAFPITLAAAVAITECVFGFCLIINIFTIKRKSNERQHKNSNRVRFA